MNGDNQQWDVGNGGSYYHGSGWYGTTIYEYVRKVIGVKEEHLFVLYIFEWYYCAFCREMMKSASRKDGGGSSGVLSHMP